MTATDDAGGGNWTERRSASQTFVVSVEADNVPPRFDYVGNAVAVIGQPLALTVQARDLDGENLSFALAGLPPAATLTPGPVYGTAVLRWTPTAADAGSHLVRLDVTDTGNGHPALVANDSVQFTLLVRSTNAAPVLTLVDQSVAEGQTLTLALAAGDQDGDALRYAAHNLPQGATLDPQQGLLQWTPHLAQAGDYPNVQFSVTDGHSTDTASITIHVTNTNQAPRFAATSSQSVHENYELEFVIVAQDNDQDAVVYSSPNGLPLGAASGCPHRTLPLDSQVRPGRYLSRDVCRIRRRRLDRHDGRGAARRQCQSTSRAERRQSQRSVGNDIGVPAAGQ